MFFFEPPQQNAPTDLPDLPVAQPARPASKKKRADRLVKTQTHLPGGSSRPASVSRAKKQAVEQQARDNNGRWTRDTVLGRTLSLFTPSGRQRASRAVKDSARRAASMNAQEGGIPLQHRRRRKRRRAPVVSARQQQQEYRRSVLSDVRESFVDMIGGWFT